MISPESLAGKQSAMRRRWQQIRPHCPSGEPKPVIVGRAGADARPSGTISLDTVCEVKQIGKLIDECAFKETKNTFATIARAAKRYTANHVLKNICDEFLRGMGAKP